MKPYRELKDFDTRNPIAIAAWAVEEMLHWQEHHRVSGTAGDLYEQARASGRIATLEKLLFGILGTSDPRKILDRGDVPMLPWVRREILSDGDPNWIDPDV